MFFVTPVSALHSGYPACPSYNYESAADAAVQRAAYDYAVARARAEAVRRQRSQEEEARRRFEAAVRREQAARRVEAAQWAALQQQFSIIPFEDSFAAPVPDAYQYQRRFELEVARRQAEVARRRQEAERARAVHIARRRAEAQHRAEAQRLEREHWVAALAAHFGAPASYEKKVEKPTASHAPSQPIASTSTPKDLRSELLRRSHEEEDQEVLETLNSLLSHIASQSTPPTTDRKGKARETPAIPFNFSSQPKPEPQVPAPAPTLSTESKKTEIPVVEAQDNSSGADLHRTPAMSPDTKERLLNVHNRKLSLGAIKRIEDNLRELQTSFVFPTDLDLARPSSPTNSGWDSDTETDLAFTSKNKPIHVYEHALNGLLSKLDAVESFGDEQVRGRRKEVVNQVEQALRDVARKVEESRERASEKTVQPPLEESEVVAQSEATPIRIPIADAEEEAAVETAPVTVEEPVASVIDASTQGSAVPSDSLSPLTPLSNLPIPSQSHDEVAADVAPTLAESDSVDASATPHADAESSAPSTDAATVVTTSQEAVERVVGSSVPPLAEGFSPADDIPAQELQSAVESIDVSPSSVLEDVASLTPAQEDTVAHEDLSSTSEDVAVIEPVSESAAPRSEEPLLTPPTEPATPSTLEDDTLATQSPSDLTPPSPTPADSTPDSFLLQSSPLPDPEPREHVQGPSSEAKEVDTDLEVIDPADVEEVLNEAEDWSDLESQDSA